MGPRQVVSAFLQECVGMAGSPIHDTVCWRLDLKIGGYGVDQARNVQEHRFDVFVAWKLRC